MKKVRIDRPSGKDLVFEEEQIAQVTNPGVGVMALWMTRGGEYVLERTVENDKRIEIYNSPKEATSLNIDTYRFAGKKLIRAAQLKDSAFKGLGEERIE